MIAKSLLFGSIALGTLAGSIMTAPIIASAAVENTPAQQGQTETHALSDQVVNVANNYISFDRSTFNYVVNSELKNVLTKSEYVSVMTQIATANIHLNDIRVDTQNNVAIISPDGKVIEHFADKNRAAGKTDVEFHWNYARVYVSRTDTNKIVDGISIAGIWISRGIIGKVLGTLGYAIGSVPNGIWFDYNYAVGVLVGNYGWQ